MGFWDAVQMEGELALWHGAVFAVVTLVCLWILTFIFFTNEGKKEGS